MKSGGKRFVKTLSGVKIFGTIARIRVGSSVVEQEPFKLKVVGPIPTRPTTELSSVTNRAKLDWSVLSQSLALARRPTYE